MDHAWRQPLAGQFARGHGSGGHQHARRRARRCARSAAARSPVRRRWPHAARPAVPAAARIRVRRAARRAARRAPCRGADAPPEAAATAAPPPPTAIGRRAGLPAACRSRRLALLAVGDRIGARRHPVELLFHHLPRRFQCPPRRRRAATGIGLPATPPMRLNGRLMTLRSQLSSTMRRLVAIATG